MIIAYQNVQNVIQLMSCKCQTSLTALTHSRSTIQINKKNRKPLKAAFPFWIMLHHSFGFLLLAMCSLP